MHKDGPTIPKSTDEIDVNKMQLTTNQRKTKEESFLLYDSKDDSRIFGLASKTQLEILNKCEIWHVDGTFETAPKRKI